MTRCRCQRTVASRIKASPLRPGFPSAPLQEVPAPSPSRIPERKSEEARARAEKKGGLGYCGREIPLRSPVFSPSQTSSYSSVLLGWRGNKSSPPPLGSSVPIHGAAGAQGAKVSFSSTVPPSSKLPLTSPLSLVRHFLETALSLGVSNPKPFRHTRHLAPPP